MIDKKTIKNLVHLAQRYPSPHNVQPAAWSVTPEGQVRLFSREARRLFIGDPERRDHLISLGAAWECMAIAATQFGYRMINETKEVIPDCAKGDETNTSLVFSATLIPNEALKDSLSSHIEARRSFRGIFKQKLSPEKLKKLSANGWHLILEPKDLDACATLHDQATMSFMRERAFSEELHHWLRLTGSHPNYHKDGLNREAMSLHKAEGWIAKLLLRPSVFAILKKMGLGSVVVTESPQMRSASAIAILIAEPDEMPFDSGRKLMRAWLKMAELGIAGCPISSTTDHATSRKTLLSLAGLPDTTSVIIALRVGPAPANIYLSPRLSYDEAVTEA